MIFFSLVNFLAINWFFFRWFSLIESFTLCSCPYVFRIHTHLLLLLCLDTYFPAKVDVRRFAIRNYRV